MRTCYRPLTPETGVRFPAGSLFSIAYRASIFRIAVSVQLVSKDSPKFLQVNLKSDIMDWDRILAWFWTVLGFLFILGFVLQSLNIVLTVIATALLVMWIKK